ncbi:uroporphyrinogen-III C-methyltransferase [Microaerobacter geothermalis]|uniref:uroporphyrinogen-III C-methyltransferase n=1 Tax=Microaerobacter geothermalis TaxID=674972 RepID=UPI001F4874F7|nr:uroporphyrinogen-III C-methyltransferase [Microaerobacter geothermalis]MCF6092673.1 uroporphyrinogen-III C-methyltransferase [Microaerobacter geothermalis]
MDGGGGKVYFVGAGPGDPKLITIRGKEILSRADVVVFDRLVNSRLLKYIREDAEQIYCGKLPDKHDIPQDEINRILVHHAKQGKLVVRLKGGDPSVFGRVGEEAEFCLSHGITFEIVPGVTSGIAASAYAGIPVTHRDMNTTVAFITGHTKTGKAPDINWEYLAKGIETLVFYMGVTNLPFIQQQLLRYGRSSETPVALVRWGTFSKQETLIGNLGNIVERVEKAQFKAPAIILVGENVRLRNKLAWFETKPFFGKTVLLPRGIRNAGDLDQNIEDVIEELGGEVVNFQEVVSVSEEEENQIRDILMQIGRFRWIVFSDVITMSYFFRHFKKLSLDIRSISAGFVGLDGRCIAALSDRGFIPFAFSDWLDRVMPEDEVLYLGSKNMNDLSKAGSRHIKFSVSLSLYRRVISDEEIDKIKQLSEDKALHMVVFTDPSSVTTFFQAFGEHHFDSLFQDIAVVCLGTSTESVLEGYGCKADLTISEESLDKQSIGELLQRAPFRIESLTAKI